MKNFSPLCEGVGENMLGPFFLSNYYIIRKNQSNFVVVNLSLSFCDLPWEAGKVCLLRKYVKLAQINFKYCLQCGIECLSNNLFFFIGGGWHRNTRVEYICFYFSTCEIFYRHMCLFYNTLIIIWCTYFLYIYSSLKEIPVYIVLFNDPIKRCRNT